MIFTNGTLILISYLILWFLMTIAIWGTIARADLERPILLVIFTVTDTKELLIKFFSYDTCKSASRFCSYRPRVACNECFDFYNLYHLKDSIKICVSTVMLFERYSHHVKLFNYVEAHNFSQTCRKIKQDGNEQVDE